MSNPGPTTVQEMLPSLQALKKFTDGVPIKTNEELANDLISSNDDRRSVIVKSSNLIEVLSLISDKYLADVLSTSNEEIIKHILHCLNITGNAKRVYEVLTLLGSEELVTVLKCCNNDLLRCFIIDITDTPGTADDKKYITLAVLSAMSDNVLSHVFMSINPERLKVLLSFLHEDEIGRITFMLDRDSLTKLIRLLSEEEFLSIVPKLNITQTVRILSGRK